MITQKDIFKLSLLNEKFRNDELTKYHNNEIDFSKIRESHSVLWNNEDYGEGKAYHGYCSFQDVGSDCSKFIEYWIQTSKKDNEKHIKTLGWIVGQGKQFDGIVVCPHCIEEIKKDYDSFKLKIENLDIKSMKNPHLK